MIHRALQKRAKYRYSSTAEFIRDLAKVRLKLLKVGALIAVSVRRVCISFSSSYPAQALFTRVWQQLRT